MEYPQGILVSGSGDSTVSHNSDLSLYLGASWEWLSKSQSMLLLQVRLWDISSGSLLDTCEVGEKVLIYL